MKLIALGSNLPGRRGETPRENLEWALALLPGHGITVAARSSFYASAPVPPSGQSWYVNAVAAIATALAPEGVLAALLAVEKVLGRTRGEKNEARIIDLDLIDYEGLVAPSRKAWRAAAEGAETHGLCLPHPRAHQRRFVLEPLLEVAPVWRHPVLAKPGGSLLDSLPGAGKVVRLDN